MNNNFDAWVKDNLEKTDYQSYQEAELDNQKLVEITNLYLEENKEYEDFLLQTLVMKDGSQIYTEMLRQLIWEDPYRFMIKRN